MSGGNRRRRGGNERHLCAACRERKARFQYRGAVRADRQHVLCFECFRSAQERLRAWKIREGLVAGALDRHTPEATKHGAPAALTERQLEHRRRMHAHLQQLPARLPGII